MSAGGRKLILRQCSTVFLSYILRPKLNRYSPITQEVIHQAAAHMDTRPSPGVHQKKKNHYICSSQLRADQMPGPPREVQLTNDFCLDSHHHV